jgi:hypothetical protein
MIVTLKAIGRVRRVSLVSGLPEDVHETKTGVQSARHCDREEREKNEPGRERRDFLASAAVNTPIELLCDTIYDGESICESIDYSVGQQSRQVRHGRGSIGDNFAQIHLAPRELAILGLWQLLLDKPFHQADSLDKILVDYPADA